MNSFRTPEPVVLKIFKRSEIFSSYSDPIFIVEMSSSRYNSLDFSKTFEMTSSRYNKTVQMASSRYNRLAFSKTVQNLSRFQSWSSTTSLSYVRRLKLLALVFKGIPWYVETDGEKEGGSHVGGEHCHVAAWRAAPQVLVWGTHRLYRKYIFMDTLKHKVLKYNRVQSRKLKSRLWGKESIPGTESGTE